MHVLYYDTISKMYSLVDKKENKVQFLGPMTHTLLKLQELGLDEFKSRNAVLRAFHNKGDGVEIHLPKV